MGSLSLAPLGLTSGYSFLLDLPTRVNPNDSFLGTYYFWWTNMTYLPAFFFICLLLVARIAIPRASTSLTCIVLIILPFYVMELSDYLVLNMMDNSFIYGVYGVNVLLTNTLNRYHPLVFYCSTSLLLVVALCIRSSSLPRIQPFLNRCRTTQFVIYAWLGTVWNFLALWMGSWWALQEGTWGGWWNWDPSETFGLLVALILSLIAHSSLFYKNTFYLNLKAQTLLGWFLISYFFIQLNFDLVSHNFGAKFFFFFNNNLFFLEAISAITISILAICTLHRLLCVNQNLLTGSITAPYTNYKLASEFIITSLVFLLVIYSYRPLVNYFCWNFFELNVANFETLTAPVVFILTLYLLCWLLTTLKPFYFLINVTSISGPLRLLMFALNYRSVTNILVIHMLFTVFGLVSVITAKLLPTEWLIGIPTEYCFLDNSLFITKHQAAIPDINSYEIGNLNLHGASTVIIDWNIVTFSNTPTNNFFLLVSTLTSYHNNYNLGGPYALSYLHIELPLLSTLNLGAWGVLIVLILFALPLRGHRQY